MRRLLYLAFAFALAAPSLLLAQSYQGAISGVVKDTTEAFVPQASVVLTHVETGQRREVTTDAQGRFHLLQLPSGQYRLEVQAAGFRKHERELQIEVGTRALIDVALEVGGLTETVTVNAEAPLVEAGSGAVATLIDNTRITNLPLNGRNAFELVALAPGVVPTGSFGLAEPYDKRAQASFSASGGRGLSNDLLLDGASITGVSEFNMPFFSPPLDAIQEFKVQLNSYSAEFGRTQGAVVNAVTRSGTNQPHGSAYHYLRSDNLDANSFFNNAAGRPKAHLRWNQFGGTLGGPVILPRVYDGRNRTFFFASYEGMRYGRGVSDLRRVPTALERAADFSRTFDARNNLIPIFDPFSTRPDPSRPGRYVRDPFAGNRIPAAMINPVSAKVATYYPAPNNPEPFPSGPNYFFGGTSAYSSNGGILKMDHNFSESHRLSFRYTRQADVQTPPLVYGNIGSPLTGPKEQGSQAPLIEHTWIVRSTLVLSLKLAVTRFDNNRQAHSYGFRYADELGLPKWLQQESEAFMFPYFNVTGSPVGALGPVIARNFSTSYNPVGAVTWIRGPHELKFGFDYRQWLWNQYLPNYPSGMYAFDAGATGGPDPDSIGSSGYGAASLLLGYPASGVFGFSPKLALRSAYMATYIQDDWRVSPRLTLNLGLRWDNDISANERYNRLTSFDLDSPNPLAGRINAQYAEILARLKATNPDTAAVLPASLNIRGGLQYATPASRNQTNPDPNNFASRVGFALQASQRWVIRGGFGIFFVPMSGSGILSSDVAQGYNVNTSVTGFGADRRPLNSLSNPFPQNLNRPVGSSLGLATDVGGGITSTLRNRRIGYAEQWNFNIQRSLGRQTVFEIGYVGSHGVKLMGPDVRWNLPSRAVTDLGPTRINTVVPSPLYGVANPATPLGGQPTTTVRQLLLPFPQFTGVTSKNEMLYNSNYHALTLRLEKRMSRGLTFLISYTTGKSIDDGSGWIEDVQGPLGQVGVDVSNRQLDRAISGFDRSQRLVGTLTYELPFGPGKPLATSGVAGWIGRGWQVNAITTFMTGTPLALARSAMLVGDVHSPDNGKGRYGVAASNPWMNPAAFRSLTAGEVSNIPRTLPDLRGRGTANTDMSLFRVFSITEKLRLQVRGEFFNAFNRVELGLPNTAPLSPSFGLITGTRQRAREGQLGLRMVF